MRARLLLLVVALAVPPAPPARADVAVLVVDGRGHGHGVGLAQDGAYWMGRAGADLGAILGHFYVGVGMATAGGPVRVVVHVDGDADEVLTFPGGGEVRSPLEGPQQPGFPVRVGPGGSVRVRFDGAYRVEGVGQVSARAASQPLPLPTTSSTSSTSTTTTSSTTLLPGPPTSDPDESTTTTTAPPGPGPSPGPVPGPGPEPGPPPSGQSSDRPVWAVPSGDGTIGVPARGAVYRGVIEATATAGPLRLLNQVDVEQYLRGMGEVRDPSWPPAALQAQAVVARTYALRAMAANGEICDTQRCQVYLGQQAEYGAMDRAVAATRGQVVVYGGKLASTVYSASGGGASATPMEGFGQPDAAHPYLIARPYDTPDLRPYEVRIALSDVAARIGYPGTLTGVRVTQTGPSGRALAVEADGSAGPRQVAPLSFGRSVGARSTLWTVRVEQAATAPTPPPVTEDLPVQAPPDDVGRVIAREARRPTPREVVIDDPTGDDGDDREPWTIGLVAAVVAAGAYGVWALRRAERIPGPGA